MANFHGRSIGIDRYGLLHQFSSEGLTASEIAERLSVDPETVRKHCRKRGISLVRQDCSMERHPSWAGGSTLDRSGYLLVRVAKDGPYGYLIRALQKRQNAVDRNGYAPEHRIVMHDKLGRCLRPGEVVHHIDGNNRNNAPENLDVYPDNETHLAETLKGRVPNWTPEGKARMKGRPRLPHQRKVDAP